MSLVIRHFDMVLEITDGGELLFPEHELEYDLAFAAMGGDRSIELLFLDDWNADPAGVFFSFALNHVSREEMLRIGRALVETTVSLAGVVGVHGTNIDGIGQEIYDAGSRALSGVSGDPLDKIREKLGWIGAGLQQQKWLMSGTGMTWFFDPRLDPQRSAVDAATNYVHMVDAMYGVEDYWKRVSRAKTVEHAHQLTRGALSELTAARKQDQADTWQPGELPIPVDFVPEAKKICVGAIVRALGEKP